MLMEVAFSYKVRRHKLSMHGESRNSEPRTEKQSCIVEVRESKVPELNDIITIISRIQTGMYPDKWHDHRGYR